MAQAGVHNHPRPARSAVLFAVGVLILAGLVQQPADADVSGITASAYGYQTNVRLLDSPFTIRGFGQTEPPGTVESRSPSVNCPSTGSPLTSVTDADGALALYGPAPLFSGQIPPEASSAPPSGPLTVTCQGTLGPLGSTSSSAGIQNVRAGTFSATSVQSVCTASESGVTGSTTIVGGSSKPRPTRRPATRSRPSHFPPTRLRTTP